MAKMAFFTENMRNMSPRIAMDISRHLSTKQTYLDTSGEYAESLMSLSYVVSHISDGMHISEKMSKMTCDFFFFFLSCDFFWSKGQILLGLRGG